MYHPFAQVLDGLDLGCANVAHERIWWLHVRVGVEVSAGNENGSVGDGGGGEGRGGDCFICRPLGKGRNYEVLKTVKPRINM